MRIIIIRLMSWRVHIIWKYADGHYNNILLPSPRAVDKNMLSISFLTDESGDFVREWVSIGFVWRFVDPENVCTYNTYTFKHCSIGHLLYWFRPNVELIIVRAYCLLQSRRVPILKTISKCVRFVRLIVSIGEW